MVTIARVHDVYLGITQLAVEYRGLLCGQRAESLLSMWNLRQAPRVECR